MPRGISIANVANPVLNWLRNVAPPAVPALWVKLHLGDPGANGTAAPSVVTVRIQVTMTAASGGAITLNAVSGSWTMTATESVSDISVWTDPAAGNFLFSAQLASTKNVVAGDTLTLTVLNISHTPLAA